MNTRHLFIYLDHLSCLSRSLTNQPFLPTTQPCTYLPTYLPTRLPASLLIPLPPATAYSPPSTLLHRSASNQPCTYLHTTLTYTSPSHATPRYSPAKPKPIITPTNNTHIKKPKPKPQSLPLPPSKICTKKQVRTTNSSQTALPDQPTPP